MPSTLNIKSSFSITINGKEITGWQGTDSANDADDAFGVSVSGYANHQASEISDAIARTLWDDDNASPADFDFFFFVADQDIDLQIIGATFHATVKVKAGIPFVLGYDDIWTAANTTAMVADTPPTYEEIDSIRINNSSGSTAKYVFLCVD